MVACLQQRLLNIEFQWIQLYNGNFIRYSQLPIPNNLRKHLRILIIIHKTDIRVLVCIRKGRHKWHSRNRNILLHM
jgi:hypothetical protein